MCVDLGSFRAGPGTAPGNPCLRGNAGRQGTRINGNTAHRGPRRVGTEITNRQNGDSSLQTAINQEASTRKTQDDALKAEIDSSSAKGFLSVKGLSDLDFGGRAIVGTLTLQAGTYLVTADATVVNLKNSANWDCSLRLDSDLSKIIAQTSVDTDTSTGLVGGSNNAVIVAMVTLTAADKIDMLCENSEGISGSQVFDTTVAAVPVGSATITDTPRASPRLFPKGGFRRAIPGEGARFGAPSYGVRLVDLGKPCVIGITSSSASVHRQAQHWLRNWQSLHCQPGLGWNTPASIACNTSATRRNRLTLAARSRCVQ